MLIQTIKNNNIPEMDKYSTVRDVRRGASRFSLTPGKRQIDKQQRSASASASGGHKLLSSVSGGSGDAEFVDKSKREKLRRLSTVVGLRNDESEMGCFGSGGEDDLPSKAPSPSIGGSSKKFKIPKKFFDDCSSVDHPSVPRKLRSAMKKRNRESVSAPLPDFNKSDHTINGVKKSKLNMNQEDLDQQPRRAISGPITKDEEEVVETLYALAGMFPDNDTTDKSKLEGEPSTLPNAARESSLPASEASEDPNTISHSAIASANPSSDIEVPQDTLKLNCLTESTAPEQSNWPVGKPYNIESASCAPQADLQTVPLLSISEPNDEKPSFKSASTSFPFELSLENGLKQPKQQETPEREPEITLEVNTSGCQLETQHTIKESKNNGSALWPGLSSTGLHVCGMHVALQSSSSKSPSWMDAAINTARSGSFETSASIKKVSRVTGDRRMPWKRCATHVYISRLIQALKVSDRKDRSPIQLNELKTNEGPNQVHMGTSCLNRVKDGLQGVGFYCSIAGSTAEENQNEARTGILLHKRLHTDQQHATASGVYASQKQSFDFLSLSAEGVGVDANNSARRAGNGLEPLSQFHIPYLHSLSQHHTTVPLSVAQTCYSSSPYTDQLPGPATAAPAQQQVQLQLPPFLRTPFCGPLISPTISTNHHHQSQQQQQHRIWAGQLPTQYRPGGIPASHISNWQNRRQDSSPLVQHAQAILPPSPSSLEVLGPKYAPILPQQSQLIAIASSLPPARVKRQQHHFSSGYEENGGGFCSDGALPLQLLCNEHL
ncbi:uncharacterized protein LOC131161411 [Malania oleifera]|uniref:uncharacterized protein LOC131161411 n=1 Tax=Malania oleifera TaxID=397392 RepID=UPI0025AE76D0|nr:uncharacterized protein LOC131161411 [Malania oleifera]XP_057973142.1 uncharacterized protein LOC131161411 [Malania oleifera]